MSCFLNCIWACLSSKCCEDQEVDKIDSQVSKTQKIANNVLNSESFDEKSFPNAEIPVETREDGILGSHEILDERHIGCNAIFTSKIIVETPGREISHPIAGDDMRYEHPHSISKRCSKQPRQDFQDPNFLTAEFKATPSQSVLTVNPLVRMHRGDQDCSKTVYARCSNELVPVFYLPSAVPEQ